MDIDGGRRLACHRTGGGDPLSMVHGFTQNRRCWGRFADVLAGTYELLLVDAPGHGESAFDEADLTAAGELLVDTTGPAHQLGYSMGGRIALHAAVQRPESVWSLVLIGATPGLADEDTRTARRATDEAMADQLVEEGVEAFLERWLAMPMFAGLDDEVTCRGERLTNRVDGLAASLRNRGTGTQQPLWDRLGEIAVPVLVVVGEHDSKFRPVAEETAAALRSGSLAVIPGVGHAAHLEAPETVAGLVLDFIGGLARS